MSPILPINKQLYPENWNSEIRPMILKREGYKCKFCGKANYSVGYYDEEKFWNHIGGNIYLDWVGSVGAKNYKEARQIADHANEMDDEKYIVIVLTIAHLDHNPANCEKNNLAALCQKCHNNYDAKHRVFTRKRSKYLGNLKLEL